MTESDAEAQAIRRSITEATTYLRDAIKTLRRALDVPDVVTSIAGPFGVQALLKQSEAATRTYRSLCDGYLKTHRLVVQPG